MQETLDIIVILLLAAIALLVILAVRLDNFINSFEDEDDRDAD